MSAEVSRPGEAGVRLTATSYVVLGLVRQLEPASPYALKKLMETSVADFHPVPHTTFYVEPARLAKAGYLHETQEQSGRRRKAYSLTEKGRDALDGWLADPEAEPTQVRSPAMLKVFFGANPAPLARATLAHHEGLLAYFEMLRERRGANLESGQRLALEAGIGYHRWWCDQWRRLRAPADDSQP
jgi:PadR family transcriptional regulator AphA